MQQLYDTGLSFACRRINNCSSKLTSTLYQNRIIWKTQSIDHRS